MTTPLLGPPESRPRSARSAADDTERLPPPFRLGLAGMGIAIGLFARLAAANEFAGMEGRPALIAAGLTGALVGLGLLMIAAERDRFGPSTGAISVVTGLSWAAVNWISPPFPESVTVWSRPDQVVLAVVGLGNGLLLAGIIALAGVRRRPTLTVACSLVAGTLVLVAGSIAVHAEWPAIVSLGAAFALVLLAWDRSPRREQRFTLPEHAPRISRAALSFVSVALCGTAIQVWLSRTSTPRSVPAVILCGLLLIAAFASLVRVRREIQQRETTLSEWRSWMREIRTNDFRSELESFRSDTNDRTGESVEPPRRLSFPDLLVTDEAVEERLDELDRFDRELAAADAFSRSPATTAPDADREPGHDFDLDVTLGPARRVEPAPSEPPAVSGRPLGLVPDPAPDEPTFEPVVLDLDPESVSPAPGTTAPAATPSPAAPTVPRIESPVVDDLHGRESQRQPDGATPAKHRAELTDLDVPNGHESQRQPDGSTPAKHRAELTDLDELAAWLRAPDAASRERPLLVAVEVMALAEYDSLPPEDAEVATEEIGTYLADTMPDADLVAWIDGPYFMVAYASKPDADLMALNKTARRALKPTAWTLALLRPSIDDTLDDLVNEAVQGLLKARRLEDRAAGR